MKVRATSVGFGAHENYGDFHQFWCSQKLRVTTSVGYGHY
jgi:hypothetical protein